MTNREIGNYGETVAVERLQKDGYVIRARNYHSRYGEIDIVAQRDDILAFVEVKTRAADAMVTPKEAVTRSKMQKCIKTALLYLQEYPCDLQPRFDVMEVILQKNALRVLRCEHLQSAYDMGAYHESF